MNCRCHPLATALAAAFFLASPPLAPAQTSPASSDPATARDLERYDRNKNGRLDPEELAAKQRDEQAGRDVVTLTPFEVAADASDTYQATNTNSVTGTNTPLNKTPLDAKVFNRDMMDELGVIDMTEMLWKFGGLGPAVINASEDVRGTLEGDRQDPKSMTMRGLQINNPRRDGFLRSDTTLLDSFDIERVEAIGGSNSLLFGSGDAGGVITSASKRAYLNRRPTARFAAMADSEGSRRYTLDAQAGGRMFALRFNGVYSDLRYFRPGLRQQAEGLHVTATFQPFRRLQIRGEFRDYSRDTIFAQAVTVRAPTSLRLPTGQLVDNQNSRLLVAFPEITQLLGGKFDLNTVDSAIGPFHRDAYFAQLKTIVAEATLAEGLAIQLRYGHDARVNEAPRASSTVVFAPGATGNNFVDPVTGRAGTAWGLNTSITAQPFWTGANGYRAAVAYQKDLRRFGRHQFSAFRQDMNSWTNQMPYRFYEVGPDGNVIQNLNNIRNAESGRNAMPAVWMEAFPKEIIGGRDWPAHTIVHPNGRTYRFEPQIYRGAVPATEGNPMGLSGPINATTGASTVNYTLDDTRETSYGVSLFSEWWNGRIDTMAGYRSEEASTYRVNTNLLRGPITYDSLTVGTVVDTPIRGLRVSANYSTNAKINFDTTRDIFNNPLPAGKGESKDIGLKFDLWDRRISGNVNYYKSDAQNFTATLGGLQNDIDPNGINGRNGGGAYTFSKTSDGYNLTLSGRPVRGWEVRVNFATANGSERSDVTLPQFYNDQFNTTTVNGQQVVGIKANPSAPVTPFMVPSDPLDPDSAQVPLTLAMMRDLNSPYYALLDRESGQITNAQSLGLHTPGVGTNVTGLPITEHQLGFTSPSGGTLIVRRAGERTVGYAEQSYSLINRYQFQEGRLRRLIVGLTTIYQDKYRAYMYTDAAAGGVRKTFYFPNRFVNDVYAIYPFSVGRRIRSALQLNIANVLDANDVIYLVNSTNGTLRYAQWLNPPRKYTLTSSWSF